MPVQQSSSRDLADDRGDRVSQRRHRYQPVAPVPNAAATAATTQAATITYSNDTTPSLSVPRRFNVSMAYVVLQHKRVSFFQDERLRTSQPPFGNKPAANVVHVHRARRLSCYSMPIMCSLLPYPLAAALSLSELAALDDRPRPGREPTTTTEAKA